jgi:hypothetical protein
MSKTGILVLAWTAILLAVGIWMLVANTAPMGTGGI